MKKCTGILWGLCLCMCLVGCHEDDNMPSVANRTVLVYMAGDNSLNKDGYNNINQMMEGIKDFSGRLVVYFDARDAAPKLFNIVYENGDSVKKMIAEYPEEDSASPEVLARVISDTRRLFPADSYGLVLWSHGLGWLPESPSFPGAYNLLQRANPPRTKYFGEDQNPGEGKSNSYMDMEDVRNALPEGFKFKFILFDACMMSSVEVAYELKDKCDYLIASPAEILAAGFPYDQIMPLLNGDENELKQVCRLYYDYYNNQGSWATIAMVKMSEMDGLTQIAGDVLKGRANEVGKLGSGDVWRYPTISSGVPLVFFDLGEYIKKVADEDQYTRFKEQLDKTVMLKLATKIFYHSQIPADKYSGMSVYIPLERWASMNSFYFTHSWPSAVY